MPSLPPRMKLNNRNYLLPLILCSLVLGCASLRAAVPQDFAVDLKATVSDTVPRITLSWTQRLQGSITGQTLYRRVKGATSWGSALAALGTTDTGYADTTALAGVEYEYWMNRTLNEPGFDANATGYISAGVKVPETHTRGKLLLLVDDTMVAPLAPEIAQLRDDLTADGWTVQQISAPRSGTAISTKALIKAAYTADPANVKMLYILGHVPVPYSGNIAPDGHGDHYGAWPADGYYADMDGTWNDTSTNTSFNNPQPGRAENRNIPGDGKFDPSSLPSVLELQVGRVDLSAMTKAPSGAVSETALLRRYLRKAHDFRHKQGAYAAIQRRTLIRDSMLLSTGEPFAANGWAPALTAVPEPPTAPVIDEAPRDQWFTYATSNSYLWGTGCGGGSYEIADGVGTSVEFGRKPSRVVFTTLFGSYFGDWDLPNDFMRSVLAGNADGTSLGLTCFWAGRPHYFMHHLGMGETIGYAVRVSQNAGIYYLAGISSSDRYQPPGYAASQVHMGLMGDPALRLHIVEPPRNLTANSAGGQVTLAWAASTETALQGYHVYRAASSAGPFTRLTTTPQAGTTYADGTATAGQSYAYMVRTLKLESAPGGTYYNLSVGEMATLTVNAGATGAPANPTNLAVTSAGVLTWSDNSGDETGFRVERKTNASGTYAPIATVSANATSFTDPTPFTQGNVNYYRVIATGAGGDSIASNEASFEAVAGFVELSNTVTKISRTVGTAQIPVERFGGGTGAITVNYATENSSAVAGTHFTASTGTLSWAAGESGIKYIPVPITNSASPQQARQFRVNLSSATGGAGIGQFSSGTVLIEDPNATLSAPWSQILFDSPSYTSPAVEAEGGLGSTIMGGSGLNTAAATEAGQFIYQPRRGDGVLTAFLPASVPDQYQARMAVMVRDSASNSGNPMAATVTSDPSSGYGSALIYRLSQYANSSVVGLTSGQSTPRWIRITRAGNTFTSESSANGSFWTTLGVANVPMAATAQWGLFHVSQQLGVSGFFYGNFHQANFQNVSFGSLAAPLVPSNFAMTSPTNTSVVLTWTPSAYAAGYRIERRDENGTFAVLSDQASGVTSTYTDSSLVVGSAYQYRIIAYNGGGDSAPSPVLCAAPVDTNPIRRPGFFVVSAGSGSQTATTWTDNSTDETGFELERRVANGSWTLLQTISPDAVNFTDTTTLPGVIYEYRLRAVGAAGISTWATAASGFFHSGAATVNSPVWSPDSVLFNEVDAPSGSAYVPTGFMYYPSAGTAFVTGQTVGAPANHTTGWLGMKITVGANAITVRELARWVLSGNTGSHVVKIVDAVTNADVPGCSATIATAGAPVGFKYAALSAPVTLAANKSYYILSSETSGADKFGEGNARVNNTAVATGLGSAWGNGTTYQLSGYAAGTCYGPVDFKYSTAPPVPFTTGNTMTTLRNESSGWFGMKITVGSADLLVSQLGRWVAPGNTGTHTVKLVNATTGADVASAAVNTLGATVGEVKHTPLAAPVALGANTSYYLLSQETAGGDKWYDYSFAANGTATGYQSWLLTNGLPMDESGTGSATATPSGDSLPNLVKYALGLDPHVSGHGGRLGSGTITDAGHDYLSLTYTRPEPAPGGITYTVEGCSDLAGWTATGLVETGSTVNSGLHTITVRDASPLAGGVKRFMRLQVTEP